MIPITLPDGNPLPNAEVLFQERFFSAEESDTLFAALHSETPWVQNTINIFGPKKTPRLEAWYGDTEYRYSGVTLPPQPLTPTLDTIKRRIEEATSTAYNSVLLNLYRSGQDTVGMHSDDEALFGSDPVIASVSFGGERRFVLRRKDDPKISSPDRFGEIERRREEDRYVQAAVEEFIQKCQAQPEETPITAALPMKVLLPALVFGLHA